MRKCWGITKNIRFCRRDAGDKWLCHLHKSQPKYFLVIAFTAVIFSYIAGIIPIPWENKVDENADFSNINEKLDQIITQNNALSKAQKQDIIKAAKEAEKGRQERLKEEYELGYAILYVDGSNWYYIPRNMRRKLDWLSTRIVSITEDTVDIQLPSFADNHGNVFISPTVSVSRKLGSVLTAVKMSSTEIRVECLEVSDSTTTMVVGITQQK